jgi:predicted RNase H-like HicB family nuclease
MRLSTVPGPAEDGPARVAADFNGRARPRGHFPQGASRWRTIRSAPASVDDPGGAERMANVRFEIELHQDAAGLFVATAVEYGVTATGRTEKEALARIMDALALHFKTTARS